MYSMIIDAHLHVWRAVRNHPSPAITVVSPCSDVPTELLKQYMGEHGVDKAVLVQPLYPGEDNSYVVDSAAADPEHLAAVCYVDPRKVDAAERLKYWVTDRGCKGLRMRPLVEGEDKIFGKPESYIVWEVAQNLGIAVNLLMDCEHIPVLSEIAERFPKVPLLIDHMAHPDVRAGRNSPAFASLLSISKFPQISIKVTGYYYHSNESWPYTDCHDIFKALYETFGPKRLIWGSDFPHVILNSSYASVLALQERYYTFLTDVDLAFIMGGNANALYWGT